MSAGGGACSPPPHILIVVSQGLLSPDTKGHFKNDHAKAQRRGADEETSVLATLRLGVRSYYFPTGFLK
jgi:hypothetical protein